MVDSVAAAGLVGSSSGDASRTTQSRNKLADDLDSFLTLLTTQLKAQDPLSPMDSTEFTNQLVQFAQVEQQIYQNESLESLLESNVKTQQAMAVNFLDSYIEAETNKVMLEDGKAVFTYGLSDTARAVSVNVYDSTGTLVRTFPGDPSAGLHKVSWDGLDMDGNPVEDGVYELEVNATRRDDADEDAVLDTWTTTVGRVTGVASDDTGTFLAIGDLSVDMNKVLGVFNALPDDDAPIVGGGVGEGDAFTEGFTDPDADPDDGAEAGGDTDGDGDADAADDPTTAT